MFGLKPKRGKSGGALLTCRACLNMNIHPYGPGKPVCYEIEKRDGNPVAVEVKPNRQACHKFQAGKMVDEKEHREIHTSR